MEHYSMVVQVPISKVFKYYAEFEKYPERYPRYCAKLDVLDKKGNVVTTKEMWNLTLGSDISHITIKVKYTLIENKEILYEVENYNGKNLKNIFSFEDCGNQTRLLSNMVPFDILSFSYGLQDPVYHSVIDYFTKQDSIYLEGKMWGYIGGESCPKCHQGQLERTGKVENTHSTHEKRKIEYFRCDKCQSEFQSAYLSV